MNVQTISLFAACVTFATSVSGQDLVKNGSFQQWEKEIPIGWKTMIGASNGNGDKSQIRKTANGVELSGASSTRQWQLMFQDIPIEPGSYDWSFESMVSGLKREGRQFNNCYVGYRTRSKNGTESRITPFTISSKRWAKSKKTIVIPTNTDSIRLMIFLSKTGKLSVRNFSLRPMQVAGKNDRGNTASAVSFEILCDDMQQHYSFFAHKKIDWTKLTAKYRKSAVAAKTEDQFIAAVKPMLKQLKDAHVWIQQSNGDVISPWSHRPAANYNFRYVVQQLASKKQYGKSALLGKTKQGFGYIAIGDLGQPKEFYDNLLESIKTMDKAKGMIVDLRSNAGGSELRARQIARFFTKDPVVYAKHQVRNGPKSSDFSEVQERTLPSSPVPFEKPIACLIGPQCISSGEAFAAMMKAIPHAKLFGQSTRGASGNPAAVELPIGCSVFYSRWVSLLPDGTLIEGSGVSPDIRVKHGNGDPTFDRAVQYLIGKTTP